MTRSLVCNLFRTSIFFLLSIAAANAQETVTISINFAADEPPGIGSEIESGEPAGVLGTTEWNNTGLGGGGALVFGIEENLIDSSGNVTDVSVFWETNNTWASAPVETSPGVFEGRGENNILDSVPRNGDRNLMTGYIDSNAVDRFCTEDETQFLGNWCGANRVTVGGLPYGDQPYDIIVYFNGGVPERGGFVKLNDDDPVVQHDTGPFDGTFNLDSEERDINGELYTVYTGDVIIFPDVTGESFVINTHGFNLGNGTFRSFINGIEITGEIDIDPGVPGDANGDGKVDAMDLNILGTNWQMNVDPPGPANGDFDNSGFVDAQDLNILGSNWQFGVGDGAAAVPEPGTGIVFLFGALALLLARRRR